MAFSSEKFVHRSTFIYSIAFLILFELVGFIAFNKYFNSSNRIVFVRSEFLIENYQGTKEARIRFNEQKQTLQANLDTLKLNFQKSVSSYNAQSGSISKQAKEQWERRLDMQEQQLGEYADAIGTQIQSEDEKLVQALLNQINSFVPTYAKKNGYTLILTRSLNSGGVLHGDELLDVTEHLLTELNRNYVDE